MLGVSIFRLLKLSVDWEMDAKASQGQQRHYFHHHQHHMIRVWGLTEVTFNGLLFIKVTCKELLWPISLCRISS